MRFEALKNAANKVVGSLHSKITPAEVIPDYERLFAVAEAKLEHGAILQTLDKLGVAVLQPLDTKTPQFFTTLADPTEEFVRDSYTDQQKVLRRFLEHHRNHPFYSLNIEQQVNRIGPIIWLIFTTPDGLSFSTLSHYLREPNQIQAFELTATVNDHTADVNFLLVPESDHLHADIHAYFDRLGYNEIYSDEDKIDFMIQSLVKKRPTITTESTIYRDLGSISIPSGHSFTPRQFRLYGELARHTITQPK